MDTKDKTRLKGLLRWYGSTALIEELHDQMVEECKDYTEGAITEGAIILKNLPVVAECKNKLMGIRNHRLMAGIGGLVKEKQ